MESPGSVSALLSQLKASDISTWNDAARQIWGRYINQLLAITVKHLSAGIRRREDEEDVLQSVYRDFFAGQRAGRFAPSNRNELWNLLVMITVRKAKNILRRNTRQRRDFRREAGAESEVLPPIELSPDERLQLQEDLDRWLYMLPESLRCVAIWKLEGYTNEEIAGPSMLDCSIRTVERKLRSIRRMWQDGDDD